MFLKVPNVKNVMGLQTRNKLSSSSFSGFSVARVNFQIMYLFLCSEDFATWRALFKE